MVFVSLTNPAFFSSTRTIRPINSTAVLENNAMSLVDDMIPLDLYNAIASLYINAILLSSSSKRCRLQHLLFHLTPHTIPTLTPWLSSADAFHRNCTGDAVPLRSP